MTKTFKNTAWTKRDYECTNVVACVAETAPTGHFVECDKSILDKLTPIFTENGVRYFGHL